MLPAYERDKIIDSKVKRYHIKSKDEHLKYEGIHIGGLKGD